MRVSQNVMEECLSTIQSYNLDYEEIGIFVSYARGDYRRIK